MNSAKKLSARLLCLHAVSRYCFALMIFGMAAVLSGCAKSVPAPAEMNIAYEETLVLTAPPKSVAFVTGSAEEQAAFARLEAYFAAMTAASVREQTAAVYAPDSWLYDNLAVVSGAPAIEEYFAKATADVRTLSVEFLQVTHDGPDYFVRWRMSVEAEALNDGQPMVSYGITQFRFDEQGRVLVHRDFWDAATGLYEYIPGLGGIIRNVRSRLADHGE